MTELIIIGNGFELAHGMKTAYSDYIRAMLLDALSDVPKYGEDSPFYIGHDIRSYLFQNEKVPTSKTRSPLISNTELSHLYQDFVRRKSLELSPLISLLIKDFEQKGWVDLEQSYFNVLCKSHTDREAVVQLNSDVDLLQKSLSTYLSENVPSAQKSIKRITEYLDKLAHITSEELEKSENKSNLQSIKISEIKKGLTESKNKAKTEKVDLEKIKDRKLSDLSRLNFSLRLSKGFELRARNDLRVEQETREEQKNKSSKDFHLQSLIIERIEEKIQGYIAEIDRTEKEIDHAKQEIKEIEQRIEDIKQEIKTIEQQILDIQTSKLVVLNFNYTSTIGLYFRKEDEYIDIPIHGTLKNNDIILGYGDETCEMYKTLENANDNELLKYFKSFYYMQNSRYRDLDRIVSSGKFRIHIMGHSCGLSDKVLLSHLFNHENLDTIRIYYHDKGDEGNDFLEKCQNISRLAIDKHRIRYKILPPSQDHIDMERSVPLVPFYKLDTKHPYIWEPLF